MSLDKNLDIIRCEKCKLIPLIDFYFTKGEIKLFLKCRNDHNQEEDLCDYLDNELSSNKINKKDSTCNLHDLEITSICTKCKVNLCKKCKKSHNKDCEIIEIDKYSLSKEESEKIENNINKYEPFIKDLKKIIEEGVGTHSQEYEFLKDDIDNFLNSNNYLIELAKIIYFTFINNKENLSYEIIQNCKNNLNFNYKTLSLKNYTKDNPDEALNPSTEAILSFFDKKGLYYNIIYSYLNKNSNYILLPFKEEIDKSEIKSFEDMEFISDTYEESCYSYITELSDGRLVMTDEKKIDIFKVNTLDLDLTITWSKEKEDDTDFVYDGILGLSDGNLMTVTNKTNLTIYKIKKKKYEIFQEIKGDLKIFKLIELHDNTIILFKDFLIIQYKLVDGKYKEIKTLKNKLIPKGSEKAILKQFKDSSRILLYSDEKLIYFNMEGKFEFKKSFELGYGMLWDFLGEIYLLRGYGDIYIMDINSIKEIAYKECGENYEYEVECLCVLKDNSFLCGLSNRFGCILKQYIFRGRTIEEIASMSFESYKNDFDNICQLKNGNIVGTISTGEYFLFINSQ